MPKNSFLKALFKGPKYSLAPIEKNNRGNCRIGEVIPVYARTLMLGHSVDLNLAQLVRFLPMKSPTMEGYQVTFDAFAVPYSTLGYPEYKERDVMDFFNVKTNGGEVANPFARTWTDLSTYITNKTPITGYISASGLGRLFSLGSLGDYLNMPSMRNFRARVRDWINTQTPLFDGDLFAWYSNSGAGPASATAAAFVHRALLNQPFFVGMPTADAASPSYILESSGGTDGRTIYFNVPFFVDPTIRPTYAQISSASNAVSTWFGYRDGSKNSNYRYNQTFTPVYSLLGYILDNYPGVASYYGYRPGMTLTTGSADIQNWFRDLIEREGDPNFTYDYLSVLYDLYKVDSQSVYDEWFESVIRALLFSANIRRNNSANGTTLMAAGFLPNVFDANEKPVDLSYFAAYWKIISDWYINTNIDGNPEDFYLQHCRLFGTAAENLLDVQPFYRRWPNDIFTSAVPNGFVEDTRIPVDGTIPQLREANAWQKLVDIFRNTGSRLRDVDFGLRGLRPSAMASEMAVPIGSLTSWVGAQSILQTSETSPTSPQAAYAGIATDSLGSRHLLKYINNEEPTPVIVMVLMHVSQRASYFQGLDRHWNYESIYDFPLPQLANIGEQEIRNSEIYFDFSSAADSSALHRSIFGFNRRYYDWFYSLSEVHGDLRDSLDYWHGAREFDSRPALNSQFIGIDAGADHLHRVFANTSESARSILYNLRFEGAAVVDLPRYIQYEL